MIVAVAAVATIVVVALAAIVVVVVAADGAANQGAFASIKNLSVSFAKK